MTMCGFKRESNSSIQWRSKNLFLLIFFIVSTKSKIFEFSLSFSHFLLFSVVLAIHVSIFCMQISVNFKNLLKMKLNFNWTIHCFNVCRKGCKIYSLQVIIIHAPFDVDCWWLFTSPGIWWTKNKINFFHRNVTLHRHNAYLRFRTMCIDSIDR